MRSRFRSAWLQMIKVLTAALPADRELSYAPWALSYEAIAVLTA
jgi:hypothetical protein